MHISDLISQVIEDQRKPQEEGMQGIPSPIHDLDQQTGGWLPTDLIILAARPGMGKSSLATEMVLKCAEAGKPVVMFTVEMDGKQNAIRMIAQRTGIAISDLRLRKLSENKKNELESKCLPLCNLPIYVDDPSSLSIRDLRSKAIKMKRENGIELIVIDYIQLMNDGGESKGNREQEISKISRALKGLAKELNIPIIALSQLTRDVEKRNKKHPRPMLSDLRESGAIEQDADMVLFLYREDYYDKNAVDENNNSMKGVCEIIIAKHRTGGLETVRCKFTGYTTGFSNLTEPIIENIAEESLPL